MHPRQLQIKDFTYDLPEEKIARYPLPERDLSKLLIYQNGNIWEDIFKGIDVHLPENALLVFNNTKVIHARLFFQNANGAKIEIFCLQPADETSEMASAMSATGVARWNCMVGRAGKWKEKMLEHKAGGFTLTAEIISRTTDAFVIEFKWQPQQFTFAEIIEKAGVMPIPPYLERTSEELDSIRYQTVYAKHEGSVAAPTAGLHFTERVLEKLKNKKVETDYVTLHVGAGTFKPVKAEKIEQHEMHAELIDVNIETVRHIARRLSNNDPVIAVGTTSLRTIESLYWMGVKAGTKPDSAIEELEIKQWEAYELHPDSQALQSLLSWMEKKKADRILCKTQIMIAPGYELKVANAIVTNFHQPNSTLLLLIAAITGSDWKKIYDYALNHGFRFLSYGDSSLLWSK